MQQFAITIFLPLVITCGSYLVPLHKHHPWLFVPPAFAVATASVQLSVTPYRLQMLPTSTLTALMFTMCVAPFLCKAESTTDPLWHILWRFIAVSFKAKVFQQGVSYALPKG